jgi:dienelactone hydrolase
MAEVLLFHHALGCTPGFLQVAEQLRSAGHTVHAPDLYDGRTFTDVDAGVAFARELGFGEVIARGTAVAEELPAELVYAGFSLGVLPAQALAQSRPGARGALFFHAAIPTEEFGGPWPRGVPLQMHVMEHDALGDVDVCQALAAEVEEAELFLYPGSGHLFADPGSPDHEPESARLLTDRSVAFLDRLTGL